MRLRRGRQWRFEIGADGGLVINQEARPGAPIVVRDCLLGGLEGALIPYAAHPTFYEGIWFRSRLEARWAAFFDLVQWKWEYEPIDLIGWTPDFRLTFPCGHSECPIWHVLLAEVKPYSTLAAFAGHPCTQYPYGRNGQTGRQIPAHASAALGDHPDISQWEMTHGSGGGIYTLADWIQDFNLDELWRVAGNYVQWRGHRES